MKKLVISSLAVFSAATLLNGQTVVSSDITTDTTWPAEVVLDGPIFVKNGATLTILPGTIVRGQPRSAAGTAGAPGSLIITRNGKIEAAGNAANPIIFTTAAIDNGADGTPDGSGGFLTPWTSGDTFYDANPKTAPLGTDATGNIEGQTGASLTANVALWGGLVVLGNAPTNLGTVDNATAKVGNIEGLPVSSDTEYGGNIPNDNSGTLRYLSVRHGGEVLGSANEINGVTLGGVGFGTTIEYCEVYMNWDDGFEFFGGTVNTNHLVVTFACDDQFDGDQGWTGQNQFWFAVLPYFLGGSGSGDEGFEFDGDDSDQNTDLSGIVSPFPNYSVYNATIIGNSQTAGAASDNGRIQCKADYSGDLMNLILVNTGTVDPVDTSGTTEPVNIGHSTFADHSGTIDAAITAGTSNVTTGFLGLEGEDASTANGLNPRPKFGLTGIATTLDAPEPYESVTYRGAFDRTATELWTKDWTVLNILGILVD